MSGLGLLNPGGALALVAVAVLVLLHLLARRRRVVPVATLFLWRQLPAHELTRRRPPLDLPFALQLALLLALIGGYLRPFLSGLPAPASGAPLVLVLDVSASMQAREDGTTRLDLARRRAQHEVAARAPGDPIMLVAAADRPRIALRWTSDHAQAKARLEALRALDTPTDLAPALALALGEARARPGTRLVVLTDLPPEAGGVAPTELVAVHWVQLGASDANRALVGLSVEQPPFGGAHGTSVTAEVRNFAATSDELVLAARVGNVRWERRRLVLAPRESRHVVLTDPPASGIVELRLEGEDALAVDDRALGWIAPPTALDLLLVTDSRVLAAAFREIAAALPGSHLSVIGTDEWTEFRGIGHRVAMFDGLVPTRVPAPSVLYVAPPAENPLCPSAGNSRPAGVIDWDGEHPALGGLEGLQAIAVDEARPLGPTPWGAPIVLAASRTRAFPLVVAGERGAQRVACLGAELAAPLASSDRLPLLMLMLGTVRWLAAADGGEALTIETGAAVLAARGPTAPIRGPAGGLRLGGEPPVVVAERRGVYRVGTAPAERLVLANLFDPRESDIGRVAPGEWPARAVTVPPPSAGAPRLLDHWLYAVAAGLLALEWLVWRRRRREELAA